MLQWAEKYGPVYLMYDGTSPTVVVSDYQLIENITQRQNDVFDGRLLTHFQPASDDISNPLNNLMFSRKRDVEAVKKAAAPFFRMKNLQSSIPIIEGKVAKFEELYIGNRNHVTMDAREPCQRLAMDTLCQIAFGIKLHLMDPSDNGHKQGLAIYKQSLATVNNGVVSNSKFDMLIGIFPMFQQFVRILVHILMKFPAGPLAPLNALLGQIKQQTKVSNANNEGKENLLSRLCQFTNFEKNSEEKMTKNGCRMLTPDQLTTNSVMFCLAGFETTSTTASYAIHCLATHPEVQEKLYNEISQKIGENEQLSLENIDTLEYLNACCLEVCRLLPEGIYIVNRMVLEDTCLGGYEIRKDKINQVLVDMFAVHHDENHFGPVDTKQFYPDRFMPGYETYNRAKSSFLAFGLGPRTCPGKNFAMLELKVVLVKLLQKFQFQPPSVDTPKILPVKSHLVMVPDGPVPITFQRR